MKQASLISVCLALIILNACGDTTYITNVYESAEPNSSTTSEQISNSSSSEVTQTLSSSSAAPIEQDKLSSSSAKNSSSNIVSSSSITSVTTSSTASSSSKQVPSSSSVLRSSSSSKPVLSSSSVVKMSSSSSSILSSSSIPVSSSSSIVRFIDCTTDTLNEYDECKLYQSASRENCRDYIETSRTDISRQYDNRNPKKSCDIFKNYLSMVMVGDPLTNAEVCMEIGEVWDDPFWSKIVPSSYAETMDLANECINYYLILRNTKQPDSN